MKKNISVDIDGVLCNTNFQIHWWHYIYNKKIINYGFYYSGKSYEMEKHYAPNALSFEELNVFFNNMEFWKTAPAIWGCQWMLKELSQYYNIHLLTNRRWKPELKDITIQWLKDNDITYNTIHFMKPEEKIQFTKDNLCETILEDHPYTIEQCSKFCNVCAIRYEYNEKLSILPNVFSCRSYRDIMMLCIPGEIDDYSRFKYRHSTQPIFKSRPKGWRGEFYRFLYANRDSIEKVYDKNSK